MTSIDDSQHTPIHWEPSLIQLALLLGRSSMKKQVPFFQLISAQEGYEFPANSCFRVVDERSHSVVIQTLWEVQTPSVDLLSFCAAAPLKEAGTVCSKLNIASSLDCTIRAEFYNQAVLFTISAPNQTVENRLLKHFFSLFDGQ